MSWYQCLVGVCAACLFMFAFFAIFDRLKR